MPWVPVRIARSFNLIAYALHEYVQFVAYEASVAEEKEGLRPNQAKSHRYCTGSS